MSCCSSNEAKGPKGKAVETTRREGGFQPNVDIYETGDDWVLVADVPGATREALDLTFEDGVLNVRARVAERQPKETAFLLREYPIGDFERSFRVGDGVDGARINAALEGGVLTIHLPKAESAKPRKIEIRSN